MYIAFKPNLTKTIFPFNLFKLWESLRVFMQSLQKNTKISVNWYIYNICLILKNLLNKTKPLIKFDTYKVIKFRCVRLIQENST